MPRIIKKHSLAGDWKIERQGRAWSAQEMPLKMRQIPERAEFFQGKLFFRDEDRLTLLALLLENVGADAAVRLGDPAIWRAAVAALDDASGTTDSDSPAEKVAAVE